MKTANLAIVFTDIQGFAERTARQTLEQNRQLLALHHQLLSPLFQAFGGKIVKAIGDAFLVTFESPTQAVLCGLALQDRLWSHNRQASEGERLEVRVSINVGEVRLESKDVFGEPVNIAARVQSVAKAGDVYFTEAVYLSMNKAEIPSEEVGLFELKGIPGRIKVFRVPRTYFRLESVPGSEGASDEQPPYGNLGLGRVPASALAAPASDGAEPHPAVVQAAELLRTGAREAEGWTRNALQRAQQLSLRGGIPKWLWVAAGALLLGLALTWFNHSKVDAAIDDVASAPPAEKEAAAEKARALISQIREPARAELAEGKLEEALGTPGRAVRHYQLAAAAGSTPGRDRLLDLLESAQCRVRSAAAEAAGNLRLEAARSRLERLAERGGQDEGLDIPLIGCNSRRAAAEALRRLP